MKKSFQKIEGKKEDEEENVRKHNYKQGHSESASATQNQHSRSSPDRNVFQQPAPSGSTTLPENVTVPGFGRVRIFLPPTVSSPTVEERRNLIQILPPNEVCPMCCNFDPKEAQQDRHSNPHHPLWATRDYNIPTGTPAGMKRIEKPEYLLDAAKGGCLYCGMVQSALEAIHPGWTNEKTFIHIYLAHGLPVVVRLEFGGTFTATLGREMALAIGAELREGHDLALSVRLRDHSKPAVDVEIYRPRLPPDQLTLGDRALSPLVGHIGFAKEIPQHAGDQRCLDFIKEKVANCMKEHRCGRDRHLPLLPDRVIWIAANNASRIQLLEPKHIRAKYLALSYCWGPVGSDTYLTDVSTFNARKAGIRFNDLPPLFQDVVHCACALGIEYIWIDRLCIIQDDGDDFKNQAPKMGEIYGNAALTIAAASASSENDRILVEREDKWCAGDLNMEVRGIGTLNLRLRRRTHLLGKEDNGGDYGKSSTRAWIWQERLLAARTVFFTPSAMKFECHRHSIWEGFDQDISGHSWSAQLDNISHISWTTLVEEYMGRDITRPSDRLPAIESVMKRIENSTGWSPLWGLWANKLVESLGWQSKEAGIGIHACRMNPGHYAPTWSWASVDGPISYAFAQPIRDIEDFDQFYYNLEFRSLNAVSGLITVAGHVISGELNVRVKRNGLNVRHLHAFEEFEYKYLLRFSKNQKEYLVIPDVVLKPWSGKLNGQHISTVVRVPYGEAPPEESWTANCLYLLVGKMKMRSLFLLLGRSMREPGAWERIGIVDGVSPTLFSMSQRQIIDIV